MENSSIAFLIITTSNKRDNWVTIKDSYLYNITLKTFLLTQSKEFKYKFYIGIDKDDRIFDKKYSQDEITRFSKAFPNVEFEFIVYDNKKVKKVIVLKCGIFYLKKHTMMVMIIFISAVMILLLKQKVGY